MVFYFGRKLQQIGQLLLLVSPKYGEVSYVAVLG